MRMEMKQIRYCKNPRFQGSKVPAEKVELLPWKEERNEA
jgi:hypothetical protein